MKVMLQLEREDIYKEIPFGVVCEAREGARWNTGRRKRLWDETFTEKEKEAGTVDHQRQHPAPVAEARKFLRLPLIKPRNRK